MEKIVYLLSDQTAHDIETMIEGMAAQSRLLGSVLAGARRPVQTAGFGGHPKQDAEAPVQEPSESKETQDA